MGWIDSLLNASMILGGMGPVDALHTNAGKIFASLYAIFSGLFLIATTGILLAPVFSPDFAFVPCRRVNILPLPGIAFSLF